MTIQFNTDKNLTIHENFEEKLKDLLTKELSRYGDQMTRLEVHLSDVNGPKDGVNDRRCVIEGRLAGVKPIAVTNVDSTHDRAVKGAIDKLKASLDTVLGRLSNH